MLKSLRYRWRFFWSRRSRGRIALAIILVFLAALSTGYLFLPGDQRALVGDALATSAQAIGSLQEPQLLGGGAALLLLVALALIFIPSYRHHSYLTTSPSLIPPVSVYVDAENQLRSEDAIAAFKRFLMEHLNGRRADLLYFLDASETARSPQYKSLYRFGFRPIDVPQNQTGDGRVKEAVDREIAMHAYERALLGPPAQEFILISHDGDFVPLVYRLVALRHRVQVWATPMPHRYHALETYLDVTVLDLSRVLSERKVASSMREQPTEGHAEQTSERSTTSSNLSRTYAAIQLPPDALATLEEKKLYRVIEDTIALHTDLSTRQAVSAQQRRMLFRSRLGGDLGPSLATIGYSGGSRLDYWIEHMMALGIFRSGNPQTFPTRGSANPDEAAVRMFAMARMAAQALQSLAPEEGERLVNIYEVATSLVSAQSELADLAAPLLQCVSPHNPKYSTHARYFAWCARALNLVAFDDVPGMTDKIRLTPASAEPPAASPPDSTPAELQITLPSDAISGAEGGG